jgi:hypothetical protein
VSPVLQLLRYQFGSNCHAGFSVGFGDGDITAR